MPNIWKFTTQRQARELVDDVIYLRITDTESTKLPHFQPLASKAIMSLKGGVVNVAVSKPVARVDAK